MNSEHSSGNLTKAEPTLQAYSLPKNYDPSTEEPRWQQWWQSNGVNSFHPKDEKRPTYSIDTPPPYPSGEFHVGNALNWCYFDFAARYHRMRGYNVHFPQGWDCHGLPTEVRAEKTLKVRKNDIPAAQFIEVCRKLTDDYISKMKQTITRLGISTDWNLEYRTMDPKYYKLTQHSFIILHKMDRIYRGEHPVNWCPRCETAIAEAEVAHIERQGSLHFIRFGDSDSSIEIASTRPELLVACVAVAVHPDDTRYKRIVGGKVTVPIFNQTVQVIEDNEVDTSFGTGAVMVCTFGDKTDVRWQKRHDLRTIRAISEKGRLISPVNSYDGLSVENARKKIVDELRAHGNLLKTESSTQNIGTCWRCATPVEIITRPQWFMKTRDMTDSVVEWSGRLRWVPAFARQRLVDWARSLDWDWVISRQRIFATPIPVWYCKDCDNIIVPEFDQLPVDPRTNPPTRKECSKCGSTRLIGETDVLDTWMDSSLSAAFHGGWPGNPEQFKRLFPADLQPNGLDIIRTWDYYLLVRSLALFGTAPYKTLLINGMVRGTDGRMMHKSYGNTVESEEVLNKFGADSLRQWAAAGGSTGYDIPFKWTEVEHARKFLTKFWNVSRFVLGNLSGSHPRKPSGKLSLLDAWLMASTQNLVSEVTAAMDEFQFSTALDALRNFTWHSLADDYLEAVKYRLQPESDRSSKEAARFCLYTALVTICKLLAPICPHISESVNRQLVGAGDNSSVHTGPWPSVDEELVNERSVDEGKVLLEVIALGRRCKAEKGLALKAPLKNLVIHTSPDVQTTVKENRETILQTLRAETLAVETLERKSSENQHPLRIDIIA